MRRRQHRIGTQGIGLATGAVLGSIGLILMPGIAYADDSPPPDAVVEEVAPSEGRAPAEETPVEEVPASVEETPVEETPAEEVPAPAEVAVVVSDEEPAAVLERTVDEPTLTVFAESAEAAPVLPAPGDPCYPAVCIDNGTILLAVNPTGELNAYDGTGSPAGPGDVGLEYLPTGSDATSPGCLCEGWGVADPATGVWGGANVADYGSGGQNLTLESFEWTESTATSVVTVHDGESAPVFRVTHEYVPSSKTPNLYQVNVTIENVTGETIAVVQYRRVMDWDIEPTAFSEFVTINTGTAAAITFTSNDGFASSNPLTGPSDIGFTGDFANEGPQDHGALFDFTFGSLAAGAKLSFVTYYGAAANEAGAVEALRAVGAEAYSFGKPNLEPFDGSPNTFIFAFGDVGGEVIFPTEPEPEPEPEPQLEPEAVPEPESKPVPAPAGTAIPVLAVTGGELTSGVLPGALVGFSLLLAGAVALLVRRLVTTREH